MLAPLDTLLPHGAPMQWIDALTDCTDTTARATVCFTPDHFAVTGATVPETALVECMAQTVAAAMGHRAQTSGAPNHARNGVLAAVSNFRIHSPPPLGIQLHIDVRELRRFGPLLHLSGIVSCASRVIASGELTVHE